MTWQGHLRQSTLRIVRVGMFRDIIDGKTAENGITISGLTSLPDQAELMKAGGGNSINIAGNTWAAVTGADGYYDLTLETGDTDTVGDLTVSIIDDSVALPVGPIVWTVLEEAVYDKMYKAAAVGPLTPDLAITLPGQEAPPNAPTWEDAMGWLYKTYRNKKTQTSGLWSLFDDAGSIVDAKATVTDVGGVGTKEEIVTGP